MATGLPWRDVISDPLLMFKTDALVFFFYCGIESSLYILDTYVLPDSQVANVFYYSLGGIFTFLKYPLKHKSFSF